MATLRERLKIWPYGKEEFGLVFLAFLAMVAAWSAAGFVVTEIVAPVTGNAEIEIAEWFADQRTETRNTIAEWASVPSNTFVKIGLIAALGVVFPLLLRRWHDWAFLITALVLEVSVYGVAGTIVGRPRPPVERLASAATRSWPSGHVAAAVTFYVGLAIVATWRSDDRRIHVAARIGATLVVVGMIVSRLYLGMHYVSDVVGGVALGLTSLYVADRVVRQGVAKIAAQDASQSLPPDMKDLDIRRPESVPAYTTPISQSQPSRRQQQ